MNSSTAADMSQCYWSWVVVTRRQFCDYCEQSSKPFPVLQVTRLCCVWLFTFVQISQWTTLKKKNERLNIEIDPGEKVTLLQKTMESCGIWYVYKLYQCPRIIMRRGIRTIRHEEKSPDVLSGSEEESQTADTYVWHRDRRQLCMHLIWFHFNLLRRRYLFWWKYNR